MLCGDGDVACRAPSKPTTVSQKTQRTSTLSSASSSEETSDSDDDSDDDDDDDEDRDVGIGNDLSPPTLEQHLPVAEDSNEQVLLLLLLPMW